MKLSKPETWQAAKLTELAIYVLGGDWGKDVDFESPDYTTALCIRGAEFRNWNEDKGSTASLRKIKKSSLANRVLQDGDILVEISGGGPEQPVGRTVLIDKAALSHAPELPKICTNFVRLLRTTDGVDSRFLNSYLSFFYASGEIRDYQAGSNNLRNLKFNDYLEIDIPLPPLNEQHRIVAKIEELFSELDKGIENLKTAREQLKVYRQALLKHAFEGKLTAQWREERRANSTKTVIPAQAGIQQDKNALCLNPLDSRLRGNDGKGKGNDEPLETAAALLARIQTEREQRYQQQLQQWQTTGGSLVRRAGKPKAPKSLSPLTAEELAELSELPVGWAWGKWEDVLDHNKGAFKRGPFGSSLKKEFFVKSGYKVYEQYCPINDDCSFERYYISEEKFKELEGFSVCADDFLISCSGVTLGRITQVPKNYKEGVINQALLRVRLNSTIYDHKFFKEFFRSRYFQKRIFENSTGTAIPNVKGVNELKAIPVPLCSLKEQQQIIQELETRLSVLNELDQTLTTSLQQAEALRQSILKKAFSGQLVAQDANDEPAAALLARIKVERDQSDKPKRGKMSA